MMKGKAPHQNKLMKIITMPIKALAKARDFYVRSMNNYADKACYGGGAGWASSYSDPLPRSFSTNTTRSDDNDDFKELMRAASTSTLGNRIDLNSALSSTTNNTTSAGIQSSQRDVLQANKSKRVPRSASVGMGKIEEDKPCDDFGVADIALGVNSNSINNGPTVKDKFRLFPRSRSYAVGATKKSSLF